MIHIIYICMYKYFFRFVVAVVVRMRICIIVGRVMSAVTRYNFMTIIYIIITFFFLNQRFPYKRIVFNYHFSIIIHYLCSSAFAKNDLPRDKKHPRARKCFYLYICVYISWKNYSIYVCTFIHFYINIICTEWILNSIFEVKRKQNVN